MCLCVCDKAVDSGIIPLCPSATSDNAGLETLQLLQSAECPLSNLTARRHLELISFVIPVQRPWAWSAWQLQHSGLLHMLCAVKQLTAGEQ